MKLQMMQNAENSNKKNCFEIKNFDYFTDKFEKFLIETTGRICDFNQNLMRKSFIKRKNNHGRCC